jgi:hypothetical protein
VPPVHVDRLEVEATEQVARGGGRRGQPTGQFDVRGRAVGGHVAPGDVLERGLTVHLRLLGDPLVEADVGHALAPGRAEAHDALMGGGAQGDLPGSPQAAEGLERLGVDPWPQQVGQGLAQLVAAQLAAVQGLVHGLHDLAALLG